MPSVVTTGPPAGPRGARKGCGLSRRDSCAPHTLLDDSGRRSGHVDLGTLGIAHRRADLVIATWSTQWNYGPVVKPAANLVRGRRGLVQPGLEVRGHEYLRIIYGPDYTEPENLDRLRSRGLGHKRSLASREYALGLEALDRVARGEPLWRVHECVFAVLALESEPVDPRL
jgi:hypothetical protein